MSQAELTWYRLSFPHELSEPAALAALSSFSGLPHGARLVFDLSASQSGIVHRLGVSPGAAGIVLGSLRAAVSSLRVDDAELDEPTGHRVLWQLAPAQAAIRSDDLAAISAGLLGSLFPLSGTERVWLRWHVRPARRPMLGDLPESRPDNGRIAALKAKLALPGLGACGELVVQASSTGQRTELQRRVSAALRSLSSPHGRLNSDPPLWGQIAWAFGHRGRYLSTRELLAVIGWPVEVPDLPGLTLGASKRLVPGLNLPTTGRLLGRTNFAGMSRRVALSPTASTRGLMILGPTGTGKTSLIKNLIRDDLIAGRGLAVVETNGDLIQDVLDLIPPERTTDVVLLDPTDPDYAVGFNPFASSSDPSLVADQLGELFQRLWAAYWGPRTGQLAHMGLLTLARRPGSTLLDLPRLYLDPEFRTSVVDSLDDPVGLERDWQWFAQLPEREQATVIAPLLNKVRQFTARPSIRASLGQPHPRLSMSRLMSEQKILLVHLPKGLIGNDTASLLGCLILTALWQAATERAALPAAKRHPFGLYVDEVQDFAASPIPWGEMFAQGRKYGLSLTVAHQNLSQIPRELREVILANARSKAVFTLSAADARSLEPLFAPALTAADLRALDAYSIAALVALDDGSTSRPVTLDTPPPPPSTGSARQIRAASRSGYAELRARVEANLRQRSEGTPPPDAPVGRKPRASS